jgi:hypothetical protein
LVSIHKVWYRVWFQVWFQVQQATTQQKSTMWFKGVLVYGHSTLASGQGTQEVRSVGSMICFFFNFFTQMKQKLY